MQQKRQQLGNLAGAILLLWLALVATVASVPTSVLAQNSELTSNTNSRAANNNGNNNNGNGNSMMMMTKVKRSSSNAKDAALNGLAAESPTSNDAAANGPDKKSSPEIVPASYNSPTPSQQARMSIAANGAGGSSNGGGGGGLLLPSNGEIINSAIAAGLTAAAVEAAAAAASNQQRDWELKQQHQMYGGGGDDGQLDGDQDAPQTLLHKRGINAQQYLYGGEQGLGGGAYGGGNGDYYSGNAYLGAAQAAAAAAAAAPATVPAGVWADELDPSMVYTDLQELDDFVPAARAPSYRNKAYDNLQSLLNAEASYLEPMVMPLQYPQTNRYYGAGGNDERSKRTSLNKLSKYADMRLKRDTKLTPADMLALVALVEAGERARKDTDNDAGAYAYGPEPAPYGGGYLSNVGGGGGFYDYPTAVDDVDYGNVPAAGAGTWLEPAMVDYYGMPMNLETLPKYELTRDHKYGGNRYASKRFMVAKKKRSMGKFLNEPVSKSSYASLNGNAEKYF